MTLFIAKAVVRICEAIIRDEKSILSVSTLICNEYDIDNVCLSLPSIIGSTGVEGRLPITLDEQELVKLTLSSNTIKKTIKDLGIDDECICNKQK